MASTTYQQFNDLVEYHRSFGKICHAEIKYTGPLVATKSGVRDHVSEKNEDHEIAFTFLGDPRIHPLSTMHGFKITWEVINVPQESDLEQWVSHFDRFKVKYTITKNDQYIYLITDQGQGYSGFAFSATFNLEGGFVSYSCWE